MSGEAKSQTVVKKKPRSVPRSNFNPLLSMMSGETRPTRKTRLQMIKNGRSTRPIRKTKKQIFRERRAAQSQDSGEDNYSDDDFEDDNDDDPTGGEEKREPPKVEPKVAVARERKSLGRKLNKSQEDLRAMTRLKEREKKKKKE